MITKIGEKDRFGYDDRGKPTAAQIMPGFVAFGYIFCARLKETIAAGFQDGCRLFADGAAMIYLFSPGANAAELWNGKWIKDDVIGHHVVNPQYLGVLDKHFTNLDEVRQFFESPQPVLLRPEYLTIDGATISHPDIIADREYAINLAKTPKRFPDQKVDRRKIQNNEIEAADDIDFLIHNLYGYTFRFDAASKLMMYANTMHFSRPQFIPASESNFFISMEWRQMAARDAAFSLYHFQQTFELLRKEALRNAPTLRNDIDFKKLRLAWKLLHSQFADIIAMRNALAHAGEFYGRTKDREKHSGNKTMFIEFVIAGAVYSLRYYGRSISLDTSQAAAHKIERIQSLIVDAFSAILVPMPLRQAASPQSR